MTEQPSQRRLDELAHRLAEAVPKNVRELGHDVERNFRSLLQSGFERMDLVTREEFDLQTAVLQRTREKLEALEARLTELEKRAGGQGRGPSGPTDPAGGPSGAV